MGKFIITYENDDSYECSCDRHQPIEYTSLYELKSDFEKFIRELVEKRKDYGKFKNIQFGKRMFWYKGTYYPPDIKELDDWFTSNLGDNNG